MIVDVNPKAEQLFGLSHEQLCSLHQSKLYPPDQIGLAGDHFQAAIRGDAKQFSDIDIQCADGTFVPVEICTSVFTENGRTLVLGSFRDFSHHRQTEAELRRSNWALAAIMRANVAATYADTDVKLLQDVCEAITSRSIFTLAWIGVAEDDADKSVRVAGAAGPAIEYAKDIQVSWADTRLGSGPTGVAIRHCKTVVNNDSARNPLFQPWAARAATYKIRASFATPLIDQGASFGALTVYANRPDVFGPDEITLFEQFALGLSFAIKSRQVQAKYQSAMEQMVEALAATTEKRDPYTAGHQRRVANLAVLIAQEMGLDAERCRVIRLAGLVHDIGKIQIPAEILNKPGKLSPLELELVKSHVVISRELLHGIDFPWPLADIAGQHHERLDGSGYPDKLQGDAIRVEAKILAVADILEAVSSHRPYRPALGLAAGLAEIEKMAGSQLDAQAVAAAVRICSAEGFSF